MKMFNRFFKGVKKAVCQPKTWGWALLGTTLVFATAIATRKSVESEKFQEMQKSISNGNPFRGLKANVLQKMQFKKTTVQSQQSELPADSSADFQSIMAPEQELRSVQESVNCVVEPTGQDYSDASNEPLVPANEAYLTSEDQQIEETLANIVEEIPMATEPVPLQQDEKAANEPEANVDVPVEESQATIVVPVEESQVTPAPSDEEEPFVKVDAPVESSHIEPESTDVQQSEATLADVNKSYHVQESQRPIVL